MVSEKVTDSGNILKEVVMKHVSKIVLLLAMMWTFCFAAPCLYAGEHLININTATVEELTSLYGVGNSIAERIKQYRDEHPFKVKEEIMEVKGIGKVKFEKIKDLITVE